MDSALESSYNWSEMECDKDMIATTECFWQSSECPPNKFEVGQKLEARDPRSDSMSIVTVIQKYGPRLKLRFENVDTCNDIWRMVDTTEIRPIGYSSSRNQILLPPVGFRSTQTRWMNLVKSISENEAIKAPLDAFIGEPSCRPNINMFSVGHKLEAVDKKNGYFICPSTVVDVKGNEIRVSLDGWGESFSYWARYDSRDLFPVGWCKMAGYFLQTPPPDMPPKRGRKSLQAATKPVGENLADLASKQVIRKNSSSSEASSNVALSKVTRKRNLRGTSPDAGDAVNDISMSSTSSGQAVSVIQNNKNRLTEGGLPVIASVRSLSDRESSPSSSVPLSTSTPVSKASNASVPSANPKSTAEKLEDTVSKIASGALKTASADTDSGFQATSKGHSQSSDLPDIEPKTKKTKTSLSDSATLGSLINPETANSLKQIQRNIEALATREKLNKITASGVVKRPSSVTVAQTSIPGTSTTAGSSATTQKNRQSGAPPSSTSTSRSAMNSSNTPGYNSYVSNAVTTAKVQQSQTSTTSNGSGKYSSTSLPLKDIVIHFKNNIVIPEVVFNVNSQCDVGPYLDCARITALPRQIGPASINHVFREIMQIFVNVAPERTREHVFQCIVPGAGQFIVTADLMGTTHGRHLPFMLGTDMTRDAIRNFLLKVEACPNLITDSTYPCYRGCKSSISSQSVVEVGGNNGNGGVIHTMQKNQRANAATPTNWSSKASTSSSSVSPTIPTGSDPMKWSVADVADFLNKQDDESIRQVSSLFRNHEIDGKALLLLSNDLLLNFMKIKLGPALKLVQMVDKMRNERLAHASSEKGANKNAGH